jgi:hypothetical protein
MRSWALASLCVVWTGCSQALVSGAAAPDAAVPAQEPPPATDTGAAGTGGIDAAARASIPPTVDTAVVATVNGMLTCVPNGAATDPWVDAPPTGATTLDDLLAAGRAAMVGGWVGMATAPPNFVDPTWLDRLDFYADGTYTATREAGDEVMAPLYYGDTERCPPAAWSLANAGSDGLTGSIAVDYWYGSYCALPAWGEGVLSGVRWDASGMRMRLSFTTGSGYGPIDLDLRRVCLTD